MVPHYEQVLKNCGILASSSTVLLGPWLWVATFQSRISSNHSSTQPWHQGLVRSSMGWGAHTPYPMNPHGWARVGTAELCSRNPKTCYQFWLHYSCKTRNCHLTLSSISGCYAYFKFRFHIPVWSWCEAGNLWYNFGLQRYGLEKPFVCIASHTSRGVGVSACNSPGIVPVAENYSFS